MSSDESVGGDATGTAMARLLTAQDDVATALAPLDAGVEVALSCGATQRTVTACETIPAGHKFAVRALASGLRIRKYGEFIGRTTRDVPAGAHVHVHNLASTAVRSAHDERALRRQVTPARLQVLGATRTTVGESPVWDATANCLHWVDVRETPGIHRLDLGSGEERTWTMREDVGSVVLADGDRLVVALRSGFAYFDCRTGSLTPIADPEPQRPHNRLNDGKCDSAGRLWCGSMNPESAIAEGSLYVLDTDLTWRRVLDDLLTPNGIAWSLDGKTMYLADTRRGFIYAFEYDVLRGELGARRVFADLGSLPGGPDGATVDCEDHLWSALWDGGCLVRFDPQGRMERVVRLPVSKPTSCTFGGDNWRDLYVTTATRGLPADRLAGEPLAGRVLVCDVGVAGVPPQRFGHAATTRESGP